MALGTALALIPAAFAEVPADWPPAIEDNSFLIEEAYNQEPGVVQYIVNGWFVRPENAWLFSFTNEWPVPGQAHQLSYTVPYAASTENGSGVGDVFLNYRYQATTQESSAVAFAPRISAIVPVGAWERGLGQGAYGVGFNLPVSRRFSRSWVGHFNLGGSWRDDAKTLLDDGTVARDDLVGLFGGASAVWLASAHMNAMLELFAYRDDERVDAANLERRFRAVLSPGLRYAIDTKKGQLVLGAAVPVGLNPASPDPGLLLYLSWEAPHWTE
jgi:hypothetical protein